MSIGEQQWDLLTVKELAAELRISTSNIYKLVENMEIPYIRIGTQIRFTREDISEWVMINTKAAEVREFTRKSRKSL